MLNPNNDRVDYGQMIAPPIGYQLDFAVGTTYSLDLDALVGACIALGLAAETDSELMKNPVCLLEALRATGDKIALFCDGGQIHFPNQVTPLYILLEKMVFPIVTDKKRGTYGYPSFHPKFWLIRYVDEKRNPLYRVAVLSRNLTFDRSWDVTFCMDGEKHPEETEKNNPVADFLTYLVKQLPVDDHGKDKQKKIRAMIKELKNIHFKLESKEFFDFEFIPTGMNNTARMARPSIEDQPLFNESFHELLIMSPFVSNGIIKDFNDRNKYNQDSSHILITRTEELKKLKAKDCRSFKIYTMKDTVVRGESLISEDDNIVELSNQDIHAKVYMTRKYSDSSLYLGSLNASHNAVHRNVEFMIKLCSKNRYLNLTKLKNSLFGMKEEECPFQEAFLSDDMYDEKDEEVSNDLEACIKDIARLSPTAIIKPNGERYDISVTFDAYEPKYSVQIAPLLTNMTAPFATNIMFSSLVLTQLSEFYKVSVSDGEKTVNRIIVIPTEGMPEDRDRAIVSSVVNDRDCFYRYISFLLGDNYILGALEHRAEKTEQSKKNVSRTVHIPALYEKMLKTAAIAPQRLQEIDYLIKAISADGVLPEGFEELYTTFKKVVKL